VECKTVSQLRGMESNFTKEITKEWLTFHTFEELRVGGLVVLNGV
jgi:hypothetical protein